MAGFDRGHFSSLGEALTCRYVTDFLQQAHMADERYTVRDGINVARFYMKLRAIDGQPSDGKGTMRTAIIETLGELFVDKRAHSAKSRKFTNSSAE